MLTTTVIDATMMTVVVTVGGSTALGTRDVTITNPDTGTTTCAACFRVNARPTITSLTPNTGARGTIDQTTTLTGTGFQPGMSVAISGTGVTATVVAVTPTTATLAVTIAADASPGLRSVTVANPDTGTATKGSAYRVT